MDLYEILFWSCIGTALFVLIVGWCMFELTPRERADLDEMRRDMKEREGRDNE
jgi:hypothetical protein